MHRLRRINNQLLPNNTQNEEKSNCNSNEKRIIKLGPTKKILGVDIGILPNIYTPNDHTSMRDKFWSKGYGLFRNVMDRNLVLNARQTILNKVQSKYNILSDVNNGILKANLSLKDIPFLEGMNDITYDRNVLNVIQNESIYKLTSILLDCASTKTFDFKWLRLVGPTQNTGIHVDNVYMNRGSGELLTCWIPLMDIKMELGTVFILDGSYNMPSFNILHSTYSAIDAEKINLNGTGHFTQNPDDMKQFFMNNNDYKIRWKSCDFKAGDVLIFTMFTVHMSSVNDNTINKLRMSCDTRWLNKNDVADSRFMLDDKTNKMGHALGKKFGLYATDDVNKIDKAPDQVTMQELRLRWGI